ncbi:MAG: periplasmic divalent cation tolerance protein [Puniceicoccaceae bacterium 5H]|nr:MAG: periplasmic divalent cation tolerance protein [Puniceicoccaceae bacterium 5H]
MAEIWIGFTTLDDQGKARELAAQLVEQKLAACVQLEGPVTSFFRWEGAAQQEQEYRLTIKFPREHLVDLERFLQKHHPYDTPEWMALPAERIDPAYARWARRSCLSEQENA